MIVPKVTLQGKVGDTRSFVVRGRFINFRAQVPQIATRELASRLKRMKQANGLPLFRIEEVAKKSPSTKEPTISNIQEKQHVDGKINESRLKNKRFDA